MIWFWSSASMASTRSTTAGARSAAAVATAAKGQAVIDAAGRQLAGLDQDAADAAEGAPVVAGKADADLAAVGQVDPARALYVQDMHRHRIVGP